MNAVEELYNDGHSFQHVMFESWRAIVVDARSPELSKPHRQPKSVTRHFWCNMKSMPSSLTTLSEDWPRKYRR